MSTTFYVVMQKRKDKRIATGRMTLLHLNNEQREYVVTKMADEFRFWSVY